MNFSSKPAPTLQQFRRCVSCSATLICEPSPSTALPCPRCKSEMHVAPITVTDLLAERSRCASALQRLANTCEANKDVNNNVSAGGAAAHMRALAEWMLSGADA